MGEKYNSEEHHFISPQTGKKYTSKNFITEKVKGNVVFSEKIKQLESLPRVLNIYQALLENGAEGLAEFEKYLNESNKTLIDLLNITKRHSAEQRDAGEFVERFFQTKSPAQKKLWSDI